MTTQKATQMTAESVTGHGIVDLDARVVRATVGLVSQVGPADLARPTPCAGWTLGDLIGHMTAQHDGWTAAAAGHGADLSCWQAGPPAADPVREYAAAAGRVLKAFGDDGVLGREFALAELSPVLRFPAAQAIGFHFIDYLVHGWDVARSLGLARVTAGRAVTVGPCARNKRTWSSSAPGWLGRPRHAPWPAGGVRSCCSRHSSPGTGGLVRMAAPVSSGVPTPTRSTCG